MSMRFYRCPGVILLLVINHLLKNMKNRFFFVLLFIIFLSSVLGGVFGDKVKSVSASYDSKNLILRFTEVLALIQSQNVREVDSKKLVENAIQGLLRTLDPHSSFFATPDYSRLQEEQRGKYFGLGITIRPESPGSGRVLVVEPPVPGTPAYKSGIKAGDVISEISGESIEDWDINEEVIPNLKGPKGTTVEVTVERAGETEPLQFIIERDEIPLFSIKYAFHIQPKIGYIRIDKFSETTSSELDKALERLQKDSMEFLVLDLRGNPGGALKAAIEVCDRFLKRGQLVVTTRSRDKSENRFFRTTRDNQKSYPMIVLIDQNSASASEIVAGALQDHNRALIVGVTSFGKALVQTIYPMDGGRRGLALTTGKYYTPNNRLIQRDYSDGFYNYFYNRRQAVMSHEDSKEGKIKGGIQPDEIVDQKTSSPFLRHISRRDLFYLFTKEIWAGKTENKIPFEQVPDNYKNLPLVEKKALLQESQVTPKIIEEFRAFLREQGLKFKDIDFNSDMKIISNHVQQKIYLKLFGDQEQYRVSLEIDHQVQRALKLLPQAANLVSKSMVSN